MIRTYSSYMLSVHQIVSKRRGVKQPLLLFVDSVSLEFAEGARVTVGPCFTTLGSWNHLQAHWFTSGLMVDAAQFLSTGASLRGVSTWARLSFLTASWPGSKMKHPMSETGTDGSCIFFYDLTSEVLQCPLYHILTSSQQLSKGGPILGWT